jgi:hypothetical protein
MKSDRPAGAYSESTIADVRCGMSVDIECWMLNAGLSSLHYLADASHGYAAKGRRSSRWGMKVGWDPDNGHAQHGAVWEATLCKKMQKSAITPRKAADENKDERRARPEVGSALNGRGPRARNVIFPAPACGGPNGALSDRDEIGARRRD